MPMAKKRLNTVARLAMGTAMLTVISGCDNRSIGNSYNDLTGPTSGGVPAQPVRAPVRAYVPAPAPTTTVVIESGYVAPGAPTYAETSQAANVQTFESVYGAPVTQMAPTTQIDSASYTMPSYDDGSVIAQPLSAPTYTQPVAPAYTQQVVAATRQPIYDPAPMASVAMPAEAMVYGESLTTSSYAVTPQPAVTTTTVYADTTVAAPMMAAPVATESYTLESLPVFGTETMASDVMVPEMAAPEMMVPEMIGTETMGFETMDFEATGFETMAPEAAPMPGVESATLSYVEPLPMTDAMATDAPAMAMEYTPAMSEPMASPMASPMTTPGFVVSDAPVEYTPMPAPAAARPMMQPAPSYSGAVEIIGNDEAAATYDGAPQPAPTGDGLGDRSGGQYQITPMADLTEYFRNDTPSFVTAPVQMAALPAPELMTSPLPRAKTVPVAAVAPVDLSPLTAPVPRPRPKVERDYATLAAPLPQPRPDYTRPMAVATTSGDYISVGSLPVSPSLTAPTVLDEAILPSGDATAMAEPAPEAPAIQEASVRMPEPKAPAVKEAASLKPQAPTGTAFSELSGTSWRLTEVDAMAVSVNAELHFDGSSGFAGGQGPCNSYGGEYSHSDGQRFAMDNIFATRTSCPDIDLETAYIEALKKAGAYKTTPTFSDLTLLDNDGNTIARFKAF